MPAQRISYEQFGVNFMHLVVNANVIAKSVNEAISKQPHQVQMFKGGPGNVADIMAVVNIKTATVNRLDITSFQVLIPLAISLKVSVGPVAENYDVNAVAELRLIAETWAPLVIFANILKVPTEAIRVSAQATSWTNFLQRFGILGPEVQNGIAEAVNKALFSPESHQARIIDVQKMAAQGI
jgi:hypothetical protein